MSDHEPYTFWWNGSDYKFGFWYVDTYGRVLFSTPVEGYTWRLAEDQSLEGLVKMEVGK